MSRAALAYWGEYEVVYCARSVMFWQFDRDVLSCDKPSCGYLPVYETEEEAKENHPGAKIEKIIVPSVPMQ